MGFEAAQFSASFSTVPLEGLVSAYTQQPFLLIHILKGCHPTRVGCKGEEGVCMKLGYVCYMKGDSPRYVRLGSSLLRSRDNLYS